MLGQLDPQALGQRQKFQHQNLSFDENTYYDTGVNFQRAHLLQQAQSHSFNADMLSHVDYGNQQMDQYQQQIPYNRFSFILNLV